jgi:hypothetical protein
MSNVQELEIAVSQLSANELLQFSEWFEEFVADQWDKKIEADILSGRLDAAGKHADDEFLAGRASPLLTILPCQNFGFNIVNSP